MGTQRVYVIVWRYRVKPEYRSDFEATYAPDGDWARLFHKAEGFLGTELRQSESDPSRFTTIDRWTSERHFLDFKDAFTNEYAALDERTSAWTLEESLQSATEGVEVSFEDDSAD